MDTTIKDLIEEARKVSGPDDRRAAFLLTLSITVMVMLLFLHLWKPTNTEALTLTRLFWPWARQDNFLLAHTVLLVVCVFTPLVITSQLLRRHDKRSKEKLGQLLIKALATPDFVDEFNVALEEAARKRVKRIRPYENDGVGHAILAPVFKDFMPDVVPAESVDEGCLAHLYRSLDEKSKELLKTACPRIVDMKIGVVQSSPLDAFSTREVR